MEKQYVVLKGIIDSDMYGDLSHVDKVRLAKTFEDAKEKANQMLVEYVKEHYDKDDELEEEELDGIISFYKSEECRYDETEGDDYFIMSFYDENMNNPHLVKIFVSLVDE